MKSALAVTYEVYDASNAASDLVGQLASFFPLSQNSCAILFAEPGYELDELLPALSRQLEGVVLIGCTATAQVSSWGYHKLAATLLLLSGDDCFFSAAAAENLETDGLEKTRQVFLRASEGLNGQEPQGAFLFSNLTENCREQQKLDLIHELIGGKPIFGGVASDYFDFDETRVFLNGKAHERGLVLLLIAGAFSPKFVIRNLPKTRLSKSRVTKSQGVLVETIDNIPVRDFLLRENVDIDTTLSLFYAPLTLELDTEEDYDGEPVCRPFVHVDRQTGIATAIADIPEGSAVSLQIIQGSDILDTTREAMEAMVEEIRKGEQEGHSYSSVIGVTCVGRHVVLALDHAREAELAQSTLPGHIHFAGYYSYGEICPTSIRNGKAKNRLHNLSIALCAL